VSETTKSLNSNDFSGCDLELSDRIEDCDSCAKDRRGLDRINVSGNADHSLGPQKYVFSVSAVSRDTVDCSILAHLELPSLALFANCIVSAVPWASNSVSNLPSLFAFRNSGNISNDFVARYDREGIAECS
jgi:hypothetical protein